MTDEEVTQAELMLILKYGSMDNAYLDWMTYRHHVTWHSPHLSDDENDAMILHNYRRRYPYNG